MIVFAVCLIMLKVIGYDVHQGKSPIAGQIIDLSGGSGDFTDILHHGRNKALFPF